MIIVFSGILSDYMVEYKSGIKMNRIVLIGPGSTSSRQMFADLKDCSILNFEYIEDAIKIESKTIKKIFDIYFKINAHIRLPFSTIWSRYYTLPRIWNNNENKYVILTNGVFNYYSSKWVHFGEKIS